MIIFHAICMRGTLTENFMKHHDQSYFQMMILLNATDQNNVKNSYTVSVILKTEYQLRGILRYSQFYAWLPLNET